MNVSRYSVKGGTYATAVINMFIKNNSLLSKKSKARTFSFRLVLRK